MKLLVIFILFTLLSCACATAVPQPKVGDDVIYMFDEYHFYEAKLLSLDGNKAKLLYDGKNIEKDLAEIYSIPKAGDKPAVKVGDFVAARYGKLPTWPTAKVKEIKDAKITVEWNTGSNDTMEVAPENVIAVSPSAAANIKEAAAKKGR